MKQVLYTLLLLGALTAFTSAQALPCSNISIEIENSPNSLPYSCTTANGEWSVSTDPAFVTVKYTSGSTEVNWKQPLQATKLGHVYYGTNEKLGVSWYFGPIDFTFNDCPKCQPNPTWVIEANASFIVN
jgi:hypothetical protein